MGLECNHTLPVFNLRLCFGYGKRLHQAGYDVFPLVAQREVTPEYDHVPGPSGVVGKHDTRTGPLREISEDHGLDRHGRSPVIRDPHNLPVGLCLVGIP